MKKDKEIIEIIEKICETPSVSFLLTPEEVKMLIAKIEKGKK